MQSTDDYAAFFMEVILLNLRRPLLLRGGLRILREYPALMSIPSLAE